MTDDLLPDNPTPDDLLRLPAPLRARVNCMVSLLKIENLDRLRSWANSAKVMDHCRPLRTWIIDTLTIVGRWRADPEITRDLAVPDFIGWNLTEITNASELSWAFTIETDDPHEARFAHHLHEALMRKIVFMLCNALNVIARFGKAADWKIPTDAADGNERSGANEGA